ncbi:rhodanese-like domain-containing protein [Labrenzia sp. OB1]|uniref:sulfurtransferase n=1 Tax=Labrenzia sp. OB1 TaxID=1561204 RepID=UPI0007B26271|nr:rhodanese-like domain-containing protein [Labrenzia sp. OB1]KZM47694.1 sulfurtransferase [Labrenzia sp. OB1]
MKHFALALAMATGLATSAHAATFGPLVEAAELSASLETAQPVLLDIRNAGYEDGHADGALFAPYRMFRGPAENPGGLVDVEKLEAELEELGLEQDAPIVILSEGKTDTDFGAAARVYWTLKSTGFTDLSILNGGLVSWQAAGLPVNKTVESAMPSELELTFDDTWLATTSDIAAVATGEKDALLVDSRPAAFFNGQKAHAAAKRPGTLPTATNHAYTTFFDKGSPAMSTAIDPAALKTTLGVQDGKDTVSFCNTGHWAATHWFAVSEIAGVENAKLYPGSMVEYSNTGFEMANTPGLLENLLSQIKQIIN